MFLMKEPWREAEEREVLNALSRYGIGRAGKMVEIAGRLIEQHQSRQGYVRPKEKLFVESIQESGQRSERT